MSNQTLPGSIPGLLRRGSPVDERGEPGIYCGRDPHSGHRTHLVWLTEFRTYGSVPMRHLALDLSDPTGRVHAAWWARDQGAITAWPRSEILAFQAATHGDQMTPAQITTLRDLVLRLAEVTP